MGWFTAKKTTYVSSVAYPLGEDGAERTDMLKYTVINAVLQGQNTAEAISQSYLRGQGMMLRNAFRYARDLYTNGVPTSAARFMDQPNVTALRNLLLKKWPGSSIEFLTTLIGSADFEWWAEQYLTEQFGYDRTTGTFVKPPRGVEANANVAYDLEPNGTIIILLMNANGFTTTVTFRPVGYLKMASYVHSAYQTVQTFKGQVTTTTRPATDGEVDSTRFVATTVTRASEIQVTTNKVATTISGGTATVVTTPTIVVTSRPKYFIYQLGTGREPTLEALSTSAQLTAPYFPSVPLRVDNKDWCDSAHQSTPLYKTSDKLLTKVGLKIDDLVKSVNDNENISDIDYAFVVFGVRLNSDAPESMQYLYRFFGYLRDIGTVSKSDYTTWETSFKEKYPGGVVTGSSDQAGTPPTNSLSVYSAKDRSNNYDVKLQWQYIDTQLYSGQVSAGAKVGTVTVSMGSKAQMSLFGDTVLDSSLLTLRRQVDANTFEELTVSGLTYENFIYQGKSVIITAVDAMNDPEEKGFIVPLNQEIVRQTPMVEMTNLAYQCMHMVFNCYKIVKQKWYQTGLFKLIIVIIAIIIIVCSWGTATPAAVAMIAAAFGTITLLTMIIAATIYVLGMMVLMSIIMKVAVKLFGPKWGAVIGMIVAIYAGGAVSNMGSSAGTAANASSLVTASNVIQVSGAVVGAWQQSKLLSMAKESDKLTSDYKTGMAKIEDMTKEFLDTSLDMIDVMGFTETNYKLAYEFPDTFLSRTLITGSDVCEITSGLVENFADVGLQLPTTG